MAVKVCWVSVLKEFLKNGIFQEAKTTKKGPKTSKGKKQHLNNTVTINVLLFA